MFHISNDFRKIDIWTFLNISLLGDIWFLPYDITTCLIPLKGLTKLQRFGYKSILNIYDSIIPADLTQFFIYI